MVCGYGDPADTRRCVRRIARATIDKSSRFTDWSRRPLGRAAQMTYALADVTHLRRVYEVLSRRLEETGRGPWVQEELAILTDPATYTSEPVRGLDADQDARRPRRAFLAASARAGAGCARRWRRAATCRARASSRTTRCWSWRPTARRHHEDLGEVAAAAARGAARRGRRTASWRRSRRRRRSRPRTCRRARGSAVAQARRRGAGGSAPGAAEGAGGGRGGGAAADRVERGSPSAGGRRGEARRDARREERARPVEVLVRWPGPGRALPHAVREGSTSDPATGVCDPRVRAEPPP